MRRMKGNIDGGIKLAAALEVAITAAREAGEFLRAEFHRPGGPRGAGSHAAIDSEVETHLRQRLLEAFPCGWLGEETGRANPEARYCWVIDPHDGTQAFLEGRRGSSVSIGLLREGVPVLGVVHAFAYPDEDGDLIAWAEGCGPIRRNGEPLDVDLSRHRIKAGEVVAVSHAAARRPVSNANAVAPARFLAVPSIAYRLALAAVGEVGGAVSLNAPASWDLAAGHALLRGAGGVLLDGQGREVVHGSRGMGVGACFGGGHLVAAELARRDWRPCLSERRTPHRAGRSGRPIVDPLVLSRAQGVLLGQVAGDALGALVEFSPAAEIARSYPDGLRDLADGGPWNIAAGQPTDDSELALALARSLVRQGAYEPEAVLASYAAWYRSGPFDIGATTATALRAAAQAPAGGAVAVVSCAANGTSQANGSLMRVSPIGIYAQGQPARAAALAAQDSGLARDGSEGEGRAWPQEEGLSMGIREFIRDEVFAPRLRERGVLVVYDPDRRYRDICRSMESDQVTVVDASESSIESRDEALKALFLVVRGGVRQRELLIYVPARQPLTDDAKMRDPFSSYGTFAALFPGDSAGNEFDQICARYKPDHRDEISRLFDQDPSPAFELIDNIGGGLKWPTLRTLLGVESTRDILFALLVPTAKQAEALQGNDTWGTEAKALLDAALGLKLKTRGKTWSSVADELWRYLLYSEFRFDLPGDLPAGLGNVPHAPDAARAMVEDLCDGLRTNAKFRQVYIDRAEAIEKELNLPAICAAIEDLGVRDTFPFEERTFLSGAVRGLREDRLDAVRDLVRRHEGSVWAEKGESREQWDLLAAALALVESCDDAAHQLDGHTHGMAALIDFYVSVLRRVDQLQREFEKAVGDHVATDGMMAQVVDQARGRYGALMGKVQTVFTKHLETAGWPPPGRLANADVFDRYVGPLLKENGRRVAYIMVDALRYELGVALFGQIGDGDAADIAVACAQMPTVTPVGMASLLPGAAAGLQLVKEGNGVVPVLDGVRLPGVTQRMDVLRARYGDRFAESTLGAFVTGKPAIPGTVSLLVLRDTEIDTHLENSPESTLGLLQQTLKRIRVAIRKLKDAGFNDVVIATDHGFFLNAQAQPGDVCGKPAGTWITVHDRSLLGEGAGDGANFAMPAERAGIRGDFGVFAGPRSMAPYRRGVLYFHGGASLQEAIVPVLTVRLKKETQPDVATASVTLSYRKGTRKTTTRLPVFEIAVESSDMFSQAAEFEILLEAQDKKGNVVGEAKPGGAVNAATGTITLLPGQKEQVTLRMALEFEGRFTVKALNPTTLTTYATLELETDYAV